MWQGRHLFPPCPRRAEEAEFLPSRSHRGGEAESMPFSSGLFERALFRVARECPPFKFKIQTVSKMHCFILQVLIFLTLWLVGCCVASHHLSISDSQTGWGRNSDS